MNFDGFFKSELVFGKQAMEKLKNSRVAVFGLGGVGSFVAEALTRAGIGKLDLIDGDRVEITNLNRQLFATLETVGKFKAEVAKKRVLKINEAADVRDYCLFFGEDTLKLFDFSGYDYIADAIDDLNAKVLLVQTAKRFNVKIISAMGAGNKINPEMFEVSDIFKTSVCPLARIMRMRLKKLGIKNLKVIYSKEPPIKVNEQFEGKKLIGSCSFVPPVAGLILAGEIIKDLAFASEVSF